MKSISITGDMSRENSAGIGEWCKKFLKGNFSVSNKSEGTVVQIERDEDFEIFESAWRLSTGGPLDNLYGIRSIPTGKFFGGMTRSPSPKLYTVGQAKSVTTGLNNRRERGYPFEVVPMHIRAGQPVMETVDNGRVNKRETIRNKESDIRELKHRIDQIVTLGGVAGPDILHRLKIELEALERIKARPDEHYA